jgi:uncharacterized damage-inducible protein DinB
VNTTGILADLFRHMYWADALIWQSVFKAPSAATDQVIRERLHHIHLCQQAWLRIWLGQPVDAHEGESLGLAGLASWAREYHDGVAQYLARVQEPHLGAQVAVPGMKEGLAQPHLWETLLQITAHSTYHRGQVSLRLREIGGEPPQTDYITWVVSGRPGAVWPDAAESGAEAER